MNYTPKAVLILGVLSAVVLWLFIINDDRNHLSEHEAKTPSKGSLRASVVDKPKAESSAQRLEDYQKKKAAFNEAMVLRSSKIAEEMSKVNVTEQRQKIAERMRRNESFLQPLLDEWNLTEDQTKTVFDTLHQRADMMFDALHESALNTPKDVGDRSDMNKVKARVEKTQANLDAAKLLGESILLPLLGRERYELLNQREKEIENKFRKKRDDD